MVYELSEDQIEILDRYRQYLWDTAQIGLSREDALYRILMDTKEELDRLEDMSALTY